MWGLPEGYFECFAYFYSDVPHAITAKLNVRPVANAEFAMGTMVSKSSPSSMHTFAPVRQGPHGSRSDTSSRLANTTGPAPKSSFTLEPSYKLETVRLTFRTAVAKIR